MIVAWFLDQIEPIMKRQWKSHLEMLPEDLLADVLRRLPPRSLRVSRYVCKAWRAIVDVHKLLRADLLPLSFGGIMIGFNMLGACRIPLLPWARLCCGCGLRQPWLPATSEHPRGRPLQRPAIALSNCGEPWYTALVTLVPATTSAHAHGYDRGRRYL